MKVLYYLTLVLTVCCILHQTTSAPYLPEGGGNNYNALSGRPCIQECQAKCGGICYLNTMAFKYVCSCSRFGK
ncbi:hypothetical protein BsWGS_24123 [Bradybaena similaris]